MTKWISCWALLILAVATPVRSEQPEPALHWQALLDAAGVSAVLAQSGTLIEQEVDNLQKAPLGFSAAELQILREQLLQRLGPQQLQADIIARLQRDLPPHQQQQLHSILQAPRIRFLQALQSQLNDDVVREAMRSYRVQVRERSPSSHRVELLTELDDSLQQTALETGLKVELRKQLLVMVTQLKTNESFSEVMLDKQLAGYRRDVESSVSRNALYAYLYWFKNTPSPQLEDLITAFNDPAYEQFMALCQDTLQASFRLAREQLLQDMRLAKK